MDTSSIRHRFDVEIPLGKYEEISSILKDESVVVWIEGIRIISSLLFLRKTFKR